MSTSITGPVSPGDSPLGERHASLAEHDAFVEAVTAECRIPGSQQALRRALGKPVNDVPARTHAVLLRGGVLPDTARGEARRAHYAVAALIANRPRAALLDAPWPGPPTDPDGREETSSALQPAAGTFHPSGTSLGESLAKAAILRSPDLVARDAPGEATKVTGLEARIHLMSRQDTDGLHRMLPGVLRLVDSAGTVPVDYACLLKDLLAWRWRRDSVATRWLTDYYRTINRERAAAKARNQPSRQSGPARPS
ncbi:type I-E CRISPR-associated protein Cse2/CasB [Streptomyces uncialis]|uniref:type I-E CRISPR-associated protein Cse2/CasB n=1 Tax=Streptomyces uncialis TaxID=1048205 RepID=UPI00382FF1E0